MVCGGRRLSPRAAARAVSPLLLLALSLACTSDSHDARPARADSAESRERTAESAAPAASSPLADSVAAADARFQEARAAVNRGAVALDARSSERHTPDYAKAYDELRRRTLSAESLRADRDALRRRLRRAAAGRDSVHGR